MQTFRKPTVRLFLMFGMFSMMQCCCCIIPIRWNLQSGSVSNNPPPAYNNQDVEAVHRLEEDRSVFSTSEGQTSEAQPAAESFGNAFDAEDLEKPDYPMDD